MRILLDTHTLIWFLEGDSNLSATARQVLEHPDSEVLVSRVSLFEIAVKQEIGKLSSDKPLEASVAELVLPGIQILPLGNVPILAYERVPFPGEHRDPFDRMLVAVALTEPCTLITRDRKFDRYRDLIPLFW